ncbi:MAG: hypothetical protein RM368_05720 [Nostoc sp. DedSLP03]|uniref:hypothetical protein n=1 Tax=Nostoc sp. DedSLP03 TaxID=3075400 RepID=UPI002AD3D804|nr:hypothetical protein [Nostoc sp. DedSLP03]MDZ7964458.1 hypothetical protein [Nostoc sp. DedSLP03]
MKTNNTHKIKVGNLNSDLFQELDDEVLATIKGGTSLITLNGPLLSQSALIDNEKGKITVLGLGL